MNGYENDQSPYPDTPEKRVCLDCGDLLVWRKWSDGLGEGYYWKRSASCALNEGGHRPICGLTTVIQQIEAIERLWRPT